MVYITPPAWRSIRRAARSPHLRGDAGEKLQYRFDQPEISRFLGFEIPIRGRAF
jgi:hypothetical protein